MDPNCMNGGPTERVGLFGGTFNPIHRGHLQMAESVLRQFRLNCIVVVPSAQPPHKSGELASARDRYRMVELALEGHAGLFPSDVEIKRQGPSYTIDTLIHFRKGMPPGGSLFFILGADAFLEIHTWKSFRRLFDEAAFVVLPRPPAAPFDEDRRRILADYVRQQISLDYSWTPEGDALRHPEKQTIHLAAVSPLDISATRIRESVRQGRPPEGWLTRGVLHYIMEKGLYT